MEAVLRTCLHEPLSRDVGLGAGGSGPLYPMWCDWHRAMDIVLLRCFCAAWGVGTRPGHTSPRNPTTQEETHPVACLRLELAY